MVWRKFKSWFKSDIQKVSWTGMGLSVVTLATGIIKPISIPFMSQATLGGGTTQLSIKLWALAIPFVLLFGGMIYYFRRKK